MAIIDNLQKNSDTVWELPATYKDALRSNRGRGFDRGARLRVSAGPAHRRLQTALEPGAAISEAVGRAYLAVMLWAHFPSASTRRGKRLKLKRSQVNGIQIARGGGPWRANRARYALSWWLSNLMRTLLRNCRMQNSAEQTGRVGLYET